MLLQIYGPNIKKTADYGETASCVFANTCDTCKKPWVVLLQQNIQSAEIAEHFPTQVANVSMS